MLESSLEEDPYEEFHGGTLSINSENKLQHKTSAHQQLIDKTPTIDKNDTTTPNANSNNNKWATNLISPLATLPNKISETLFTRKPQPKQDKQDKVQSAICIAEDPNNFFTFREGVIAKALTECKEEFLDENCDGPLIEAFLLTQISNWNADKERLILLTPSCIVIAKYDFIALKRLAYKKLPLEVIDEIIIGELIYPSVSLIPHMNGFFDGLNNVLETCLFAKWSKSNDNKQLSNFYQPRDRHIKGIRLIWNEGKLNFGSQWNPFNEDLPFCTFTFHPLYFHTESMDENLRNLYNLDIFIDKLCMLIKELPKNKPEMKTKFGENSILLQNYVGIGSIIHNRNALGFFKVRGKFSF